MSRDPDTNLLEKSPRISSGLKAALRFPIRDFEEELWLTAQGRPAISRHIVCAAVFYIQYSSHRFRLIKNLSLSPRRASLFLSVVRDVCHVD